MTIAARANRMPETGDMFLPSTPRMTSMNSTADITPAFVAALFHVGGRSIRSWRARLRSSAGESLEARLVRPRASTIPAAFPRCFVRRLRLVWAMVLPRIEALFDRCAVPQRDLRGEVLERLRGGERDELGSADRCMGRDGTRDLRGGRGALEVGADL